MKDSRPGISHILTILICSLIMAGAMPFTAAAEVEISGPIVASDWQTVRKAVNDGSGKTVTIRVVKDLTVSGGNAHNEGNTVEIDLNGHTINGNSMQVFWNEKG